MECLGHILDDGTNAIDADELCASRRATLQRDSRPRTTEVASNERQELLVRLAVHGLRLELGQPRAALQLGQEADASAWPDLDRDNGGVRFAD